LAVPRSAGSGGAYDDNRAKRCLSDSEFFSPRDCHDKQRAPQGIQRYALDTDTGHSVLVTFDRNKSNPHQLTQ